MLASFVAAAALMAASPASAGYDVIYLDEYNNIVGYEMFCAGMVVQSWGIVTDNILWFYRNC